MAIEDWARTHYEEGGGDALVAFWVFGELTKELEVSGAKHRVRDVPRSLDVHRLERGTAGGDSVFATFTDPAGGVMGAWLDRDPVLARAVRDASAVHRIAGPIEDPDDLLYLRNVIGLVHAMLESGGVGVTDHAFHWWSADRWKRDVFDPDAPRVRELVSILSSENDDGTVWLHTRGMRLFGRPDVSVESVPSVMRSAAEDLVVRLVNMQAMGGIVPDGQPVKMKGIPAGWICKHAGDVDDPDFNNVHLAIGPG